MRADLQELCFFLAIEWDWNKRKEKQRKSDTGVCEIDKNGSDGACQPRGGGYYDIGADTR